MVGQSFGSAPEAFMQIYVNESKISHAMTGEVLASTDAALQADPDGLGLDHWVAGLTKILLGRLPSFHDTLAGIRELKLGEPDEREELAAKESSWSGVVQWIRPAVNRCS